MRRYINAILMAILAAIIMAAPVLAAYYANITVTESNGTDYDMLAVNATIDVDYLADNQYIEADGRDVRVKTGSGAEVPFMLVDDKVLFAAPIANDRQNAFRFSTDNSLIDDYAIVTGDGGYVTITDNANLELGDDFEIEFDGYIEPSETQLGKDDAFTIYSDADAKVSAEITYIDTLTWTSPTSYVDVGSEWSYEAEAYDDLITGGAYTAPGVSTWSDYLELPHAAIYCTKIRYMCPYWESGQQIDLDVYYNDSWNDIYIGAYPDDEWVEKDLPAAPAGGYSVTNVRVRLRAGGTGGGQRLRELDYGEIPHPTITVSSADASLGEHVIKVTADGSDMKLYIDDVLKDTESLGGQTVYDSTNDWLISLPYFDYYKHTTSDTLRLTYQPDDIISGTTLPNELNPGTYDGTITYGSNPAGVSVSVGGLETYETSYPTDAAGSQDIIRPTTAPLFDVDLDRLSHNPIQPIVALIADTTNLTERLVWLAGAFVLLFVILLVVLWKTEGQITFTAFAGLGFCVIAYILGIFPLWTIIVFAIGAVASLIWERVIAL